MDFDYWTFAIQAINFGIVVFILQKLLYKPVRKIMQERQDDIAKQISDADSARTQAEALRAEYEKKLADARAEADKLRAERLEQAEKQAEQITLDAREDAAKLRDSAKASIIRDRERAADDLRTKVVDAAAAIAGAMGVSADPAASHDHAVGQIEKLLAELDDDAKQDVAEDLAADQTIRVATAPELSDAHKQRLAKALAQALAVNEPTLDVTLDEALVAGVEVRVGRLILKAHWRDRIDAALLDPQQQAGAVDE